MEPGTPEPNAETLVVAAPGSAAAGPGGGAPGAPGPDLPAPPAGAGEQRPAEGRPVLAPVQQQQPQLRTALQLLHAVVPVHAAPDQLEHGQQPTKQHRLHVLVHHARPVRVRDVVRLKLIRTPQLGLNLIIQRESEMINY